MIGRLSGRRAFRELDELGRRGRSGPLTVVHLGDPLGHTARVGYAIPRKVGPAVVRNRTRRRLRAQVRGLARTRPDLVEPGSWLVVVRPPAAAMSSSELARSLTEAMVRVTGASR